MRIDEYITFLRNKNIIISVHEGQLAVHDDDDALTQEIIQELKIQKENIIGFFDTIKNKSTLISINKAPELVLFPVSSAQKRMYFLYEFDKEDTSYNIPLGFHIQGKLDIENLETSIFKLINRHECLRTIYSFEDHTINQKVIGIEGFTLDYKRGNLETVDKEFTSFIKPFNLNQDYPIRVSLLTISKEVYFLFIDIHHIAGDLHSIDILTKDLLSFYNGYELPKLKLQYKDYAYWQQQKEQQQNYSNKKEFWLSEYKTHFEKLNLPIDYEYPLLRTNKGNSIDFVIEEVYVKKLQSIAQSVDGTFFMSLFSVFSIFLSKISNTDDIIIGSPVVGREHSNLEEIVGMFVNTLAIRNQVNSDQVFHEFLINVKNKITQCIDNQLYQYEELLETLNVSRDTSRNPLFNVMIVHIENEQKLDKYQINDVVFKEYEQENTTAKFDLLLKSVITNGELHGRFQYNTDIFSEVTIRRLQKYFIHLLKQITTESRAKIKDLQLLEVTDQKVLLENFNSTDKLYDVDKTFSEWFTEQAQKTPTNIALTLAGKELTYEALETQSNQLARHLRGLGVSSNTVVGILQQRSMEVIVSILGVLKSGGAYLPIDLTHPTSRISTMISDSKMMLLLTDNQTNELTFVNDISRLNLSTFTYEDHASEPLINQNTSKDLLYILYTSGSTGVPKGVMLTHRNLVNLLDYHIYSTTINTSSVLQFTPLTFDPSFKEIFSALLTGGTLHLLTEEESKDFSMILSRIQEKEVCTIFMPSSILNQLFNNSIYKDELPQTLTNIVTAGEQVVIGDLFKAYLLKYQISLHNHYGPAETHVVTANVIEPNKDMSRIPHIGVPIQNTQIYILSKGMCLQPIGIVGELYIGGAQVGLGYLNKEDLTKERFINNPYGEGKLYKTGDLAKWNDVGALIFLGRIDHQVKINGVRIELGEIENHICNIAEIKDSIVTVKEVAGEKVLVCYCISYQEYSLEKLQQYLLDYLPVTMIPRYYIQMESFPTTLNGKLDRKALPEVILEKQQYLPADTDIEKQLSKLWQGVLVIEASEIGVTHNFFELGGNSLKAMVLINGINKDFSVKILLRDIFQYQTIRSLAEYISGLEQEEFISIPSSPKKDFYPLSSAQKRMYFLYEFDKENTTYNIPGAFEIFGNLDVSHLEAVFLKLIERHESLRTVFEFVSSVVVQKLLADYRFEIPFVQVIESKIKQHISNFVRPFNLSLELPFRVSLLYVNENKHILLVDMHHIISDGVSMKVLLRDFWSLYQRETLNPLRIQYKDYAVWQQSDSYNELVASAKVYWEEIYSRALPNLEIPMDFSRPLYRSAEGISYRISLSDSQVQGLRMFSQGEGITVYTLLLSIYKVFLHKLSGSEDIIVGTVTAGRHHADMENLVGMFVNTLSLRNGVNPEDSFRSFVAQIHRSTLSAFENHLYQYEDLIDLLGIERNTSRNPLFDVFFLYMESLESSDFETSGINIIPYKGMDYVHSKFDLSFEVSVSTIGITIGFNGRKDLFLESTLQRFSDYLCQIIDQVLINSDTYIGKLSIIGAKERGLLLQDFNNTSQRYNLDTTVLDVFREQVILSPSSIAIEFNEQQVSYEELDARSDCWSAYLISKGAGKGVIIAMLMTRSVEMITGILAIIKSGSAYLPIDSNQPESRTKHILEESMSHILISNLEKVSSTISEICPVISSKELDNHAEKASHTQYPTVDNLAYIIYTSGSTGLPKGVMINHKSLSNLIQYEREFLEVTHEEKILQFSPYYFDVSVQQIWLSLTTGSTLVLVAKETLGNKEGLVNYISKQKITLLNVTPSYLESLELPDIPSLQKIVVSGEECAVSLAIRYNTRYKFYNEYGPTEATIISISNKITASESAKNKLSIGKPIANMHAYILTAKLELVPIGSIGELYLCGVGVSDGYLNNPKLTAERFLPNPYGSGKLYKTGDLASWNTNGTINYLGRVDQQIKYNGVRIEAGEIENQICQILEIKECAVTVKNVNDTQSLIAYYVSEKEQQSEDIQLFLSERLPLTMIPRYYKHLAKMPITVNGKLDREKLPEIIYIAKPFTSPKNSTEEQLVAIWATLLNIESSTISMHDGFFDLGGNSLKAITLANSIAEKIGIEISLKEMFLKQTIRKIAVYIIAAGIIQETETNGGDDDEIKLII